jgi:hypothetical protein
LMYTTMPETSDAREAAEEAGRQNSGTFEVLRSPPSANRGSRPRLGTVAMDGLSIGIAKPGPRTSVVAVPAKLGDFAFQFWADFSLRCRTILAFVRVLFCLYCD